MKFFALSAPWVCVQQMWKINLLLTDSDVHLGTFARQMTRKTTKNPAGTFKRDLRKEILSVFEKNGKKPLNHKQVAAELGISDAGVRKLVFEIMAAEAASGALKEIEHGKFRWNGKGDEAFEGIIEINRYGKGFVAIPGFDRDIQISQGDTGLAMWGDRVELSFNPRARRPQARVTKVLERMRKAYVGVLDQEGKRYFISPSDSRIHVEFEVPEAELNGAKKGDKVVSELVRWDNPRRNPEVKITRVLGKPGEHFAEMHAIIAEYGLPEAFPDDVVAESEKIGAGITPDEIARRRDLREITTFTIDPYDAKDFDDALSFQVLPNGNTEVGVHIADVSFYLSPASRLEAEAFERATSVYLVDRTIPMLPERLSNELCSLRPNEEKLCFSAVFELDKNANIKQEWFGRTVIYSDRRFTYEEAQERIETGKGDFADEIRELDRLAKLLRKRRFQEGSIDFNSEEVKFKLDEKGKPLGVTVKVMKDSNQLIEDFMLLANRRVAEFVGNPSKGMARPFVYRIHDKPDPDKLQQLRTFLKHLGYKLPRPTDSPSGNVIKELMSKIEGQPEEPMIRTMAIRSMMKAEYSPKNIGHFGLAFPFYTHFTSPIRRYPDVMVHRLLAIYLANGKGNDERDLEWRCKHSSLMEKRAAEAERASIKYKQVEYMLMHTDMEFEAVISGLTSWGIYAEVKETRCEGLISLQSLNDDMYQFEESKYIIRGLRKKKEFHMGDIVRIRVRGGDLQRRTLDYILVTEPR
ncbi:MAG: ribonuclease [Bacteroidota bacterium]